MRGDAKQIDKTYYITPDGIQYNLDDGRKGFLLSDEGYGMPPIEYITQRGPFQHGESVMDFFLRPRTFQLTIRKQGCSRAEYWNIRNALLDMLRPGRLDGGPEAGTLRKVLANGMVRDLQAYVSEGPSFPGRQLGVWDEWSIQDTIRFTAFDPIARDPTLHSQAFISSGTSVFAFPVTFPVTFGGFSGAEGIVYHGTWLTYPVLRLNGPLTSPHVENLTTGETFILGTTIATGRQVTVDFGYGAKTVTLDDGTNMIGYVTTDSALGTFHLNPGINNFQVTATGASAISSVVIEWYERFIGV